MGATINQLSALDALVASDLFPVYSSSSGDARKVAASVLLAYIQNNLTSTAFPEYTTQYSAPSATGFTVAVTAGSANIHLILTPVAGYAAGTITLPVSTGLVDKQEFLCNCTQAVTTLTIDGNGATAVTGEPTTLTANDFFRLRYDAATSTWYRVG
jgi:hypothetical protein